jgi:ribose 1,5-bisphosphokinase
VNISHLRLREKHATARVPDVNDFGTAMLILVVGPSGAGKDTLLDAARLALGDDSRFRFVRRVITRPAQVGGEAHEAVTREEFAARRFALRWHAHDIDYGIPEDIEGDLAVGRAVVASVSRGVIAEAASRYSVRVIEVTAPPEVLAERLAARGREDAAAIAERLARYVPLPVGVPMETVSNDSTLAEGAARFLAALSCAAESARR